MSQPSFVALLGTKGGPAIRPGSAMPTASLLVLAGRHIVVDCGLGVTRGLVDQGMELKDLREIFITHLHSDHYLELGPLIHTAWTAGLARPVTIWGPEGLTEYWQGFLASMRADIDLRIADEGRPDVRDLVRIEAVDAGDVMHADTVRVSAMRVLHPPLVDCFAYRFEGAGKRVVFSGDTARCEALVGFAQDADLLVHEAMLEEALPALFARVGNGSEKLMAHLRGSHTSARDAAGIAVAARVKRLALHHLVPSDDPDYDCAAWLAAVAPSGHEQVIIGHDGLRIDLA